MASERDRPYAQFNFKVQIDGGPDKENIRAGFQEVTGLGMEITVSEYRGGNFKDNTPMKVTGTYKIPDVTLKRGLLGDVATLAGWISQVRNGNQRMLRTVTIELWTEDHSGVAQTWKLSGARPTKYTGPSLSAKGTDVAIEELVLACERIDIS